MCAQNHRSNRMGAGSGYRSGDERLGSTSRVRLDSLLAERGLYSSRSRAAVAVMAGEVRVGTGERRAAKPSELIDPREPISVCEAGRTSSRGGVKLENALVASGLDVTGSRALDVGSSTGGFTDCLLQRGAASVVAVDVGYGLLDYGPRNDPRVSRARAYERARADPGDAARRAGQAWRGARADRAPTIDVSFISLALDPARGARVPGRHATTCWRWSSPSSRSAASAWPKAGCGARRARPPRRAGRRGQGRARAGGERARLPLLGAARAEGQPRDVHPPRRARARRRRGGSPGVGTRMALEVEP